MDKLSPKDKRILAFLANPATSREVADGIGSSHDSIYPHLRLLQRLGLVKKVGRTKNLHGAGSMSIFHATGATEIVLDDDYMQIAAHNPFNIKPKGVCHA